MTTRKAFTRLHQETRGRQNFELTFAKKVAEAGCVQWVFTPDVKEKVVTNSEVNVDCARAAVHRSTCMTLGNLALDRPHIVAQQTNVRRC